MSLSINSNPTLSSKNTCPAAQTGVEHVLTIKEVLLFFDPKEAFSFPLNSISEFAVVKVFKSLSSDNDVLPIIPSSDA